MFDSAEFDSWAQTYDAEVVECDNNNAFLLQLSAIFALWCFVGVLLREWCN